MTHDTVHNRTPTCCWVAVVQVTLHNSALINMDRDPAGGFKKLNFLLSSPPFPPETFGNLLLLYCAPTHQFYDLAADVMAENPQYCQQYLSKVSQSFVSSSRLPCHGLA